MMQTSHCPGGHACLYYSYDDHSTIARIGRRSDENEKRSERWGTGVYGISGESADRLFDYCYTVTPVKYHNVPRH